MTDVFARAHAFTARWEGGYAEHKNDPGGATNYGVSLRWIQGKGLDVDGDGRVDINDIRKMTPEIAASLYHEYFWDHLGLDRLAPLVAITVYDGAVNLGCSQAVRHLQVACNRFSGTPRLVMDGVIGPQTVTRAGNLSQYPSCSQLALCQQIVNERDEFYRRLAARPPYVNSKGQTVDYRPFLSGWLSRTGALMPYLSGLAKGGYS